jgi:uncharacterized membrane protein
VDIEAQILGDGSLQVVEHRTVRFRGAYSAFDQWIPTEGTGGITDVLVSEAGVPYRMDQSENPGTFSVQRETARAKITWNYQARDEERTFDLSYRVLDAVRVHRDVAELYWKAVGDQWDVGADRVRITVFLPEETAPGDVRAWGHGPLQGTVNIRSDGSAVWEVAEVPPRRFVEVRLVFPPALCPQAGSRTETTALPQILREEERWAAQANRRRTADLLQLIAGVAVLLGAGITAVRFQLKYGKEYQPDFESDYYRELPGNYGPAVVSYLLNFGKADTRGFTATILDLARRGYLIVEERPAGKKRLLGMVGSPDNDYVIKVTDKGHNGLEPYEQDLLAFIVGRIHADGELTFKGIEKYAKGATTNLFRRFFQDWQGAVAASAQKEEFIDKTINPKIMEIGIGAVLTLAGAGAWLAGAQVFAVCCFIAGLILVIAGICLRRRTRKGSTHLKMWRAFKRFLLHFSNLDRAQIPSLIIWEHYLVYAVVLGVAKEVLDQLKVVFPAAAAGDYHLGRGWFSSSLPAGARGDPFTGLAAAASALQQSIHTAATYTPSSGTGRGGGFSGGGGGGFGGGGGRAR